MNIIIKILFLSVMWNFLNIGFRSLDKYNVNKFSIFRSMCCLTIVIYGLINIIKFGKKPFGNPFFSTAFEIKDLNNFFIAYLIHDLINMAITKLIELSYGFTIFFFGNIYISSNIIEKFTLFIKYFNFSRINVSC